MASNHNGGATPPETRSVEVLDGWSLPADWTASARDLFAEVLSQRPWQ